MPVAVRAALLRGAFSPPVGANPRPPPAPHARNAPHVSPLLPPLCPPLPLRWQKKTQPNPLRFQLLGWIWGSGFKWLPPRPRPGPRASAPARAARRGAAPWRPRRSRSARPGPAACPPPAPGRVWRRYVCYLSLLSSGELSRWYSLMAGGFTGRSGLLAVGPQGSRGLA